MFPVLPFELLLLLLPPPPLPSLPFFDAFKIWSAFAAFSAAFADSFDDADADADATEGSPFFEATPPLLPLLLASFEAALNFLFPTPPLLPLAP